MKRKYDTWYVQALKRHMRRLEQFVLEFDFMLLLSIGMDWC